jgi:hypothetical protein
VGRQENTNWIAVFHQSGRLVGEKDSLTACTKIPVKSIAIIVGGSTKLPVFLEISATDRRHLPVIIGNLR